VQEDNFKKQELLPTSNHGKKQIKPSKFLQKNIEPILEIQETPAKEAGSIGLMPLFNVSATIPHNEPKSNEFVRNNGNYSLIILAPSSIGLPYGSTPRSVLAWLCTEAVRTQNRTLDLGNSLAEFARNIGITLTGGNNAKQLNKQLRSLFSTAFYCVRNPKNKKPWGIEFINPIEEAKIYCDVEHPETPMIFKSTVTLTQKFYAEITNNAVPIDLRVLNLFSKSPLRMDIYCWMTYRAYCVSQSKEEAKISWWALKYQFGSDYKDTPQGKRNFKRKFTNLLQEVDAVCTQQSGKHCFDYEINDENLIIKPKSVPHIPEKPKEVVTSVANPKKAKRTQQEAETAQQNIAELKNILK
jgi:replication initiator protein